MGGRLILKLRKPCFLKYGADRGGRSEVSRRRGLQSGSIRPAMRYGCSRMVILLGPYAVKLPNLKYRWPAALWGIIHNLSERNWWRSARGEFDPPAAEDRFHIELRRLLCPVVWGDRFGLCLIMRRAEPLPRNHDCPVMFEWLAGRFDLADCGCPAEKKADSFGVFQGEIVAIDYA